MSTIACDTSYFQDGVTDAYAHPWYIFRACDGTFRDPMFAHNYAWSKGAANSGKLTGFTAYIVYRPGQDALATVKAMVGKPDPHLTVMIDVESWGGEIKGDHSKAITALANGLATWLGDKRRVLAYGNAGDLGSIYPTRPSWLRLVVAAYGVIRPNVHNAIGWQYSDGQAKWARPAGLPRSSAPFGACDHNVFPDHTPAQLAETLGVGEDDPMANLTAAQLDQIAEAVWSRSMKGVDGATHMAQTHMLYGRDAATKAQTAAVANGKKIDGLTQMIGTAKTGVLARVAALQTAVSALATSVAAMTPAGAITVDVQKIVEGVNAVVPDAVAAKVKALTWKAAA